ncbi:MAG: SOS response-associated peptidase [Cyclobacteriaceae bacterium]
MCGRYVLVTKIKKVEKRFNVQSNIEFEPNTNISTGELAPVIASNDPSSLSLFEFGFTPFWSEKKTYMINARSEGNKNKENDPNYSGAMDIVNKPMFRKAIRSQRCLVPADCFIEGPTGKRLNEPYVVYLRDKRRPFSFAGIWDEWVDKDTGEVTKSFAIITTTPNKLMEQIGHHRSPVILHPEHESTWLNAKSPMSDILPLLQPFPFDQMNAYPISPKIKSPRANGLELLDPVGEKINPEYEYSIHKELKLVGMGHTSSREKRNKEKDS